MSRISNVGITPSIKFWMTYEVFVVCIGYVSEVQQSSCPDFAESKFQIFPRVLFREVSQRVAEPVFPSVDCSILAHVSFPVGV